MSRRDRKHLLDMLLEARRIERFLEGMDEETFASDELPRYAVMHALIILGEAAAHVSAEGRAAHPAIPWEDIIGMRNRIIHEYFRVSTKIVWNTVRDDLPELIPLLEAAAPDPSQIGLESPDSGSSSDPTEKS
jgi:uncharacterized protein with HEPN domain